MIASRTAVLTAGFALLMLACREDPPTARVDPAQAIASSLEGLAEGRWPAWRVTEEPAGSFYIRVEIRNEANHIAQDGYCGALAEVMAEAAPGATWKADLVKLGNTVVRTCP